MSATMLKPVRLIRVQSVDRNPNNPDWRDANHWQVTLGYSRRRLTTYFSMGLGLHGEPEAASVLECLMSDAQGYINALDFSEWCSEYGYDTDSRKAEGIWRVVQSQTRALRRFFGSDWDNALAQDWTR